MTFIKPHEGDKGKIYDKYSKTYGQKEEGFIFLGNCQINKEAPYPPHDKDVPLKIVYPGGTQGTKQHVQYFVNCHTQVLVSD